MLRLTAGDWTAALLPEMGAIAELRWRGRDVLRPAPPDPRGALETACFPLVPYANRIAHGRFTFDGSVHTLPLNFGDHPHSLHGIGWQRNWAVDQSDGSQAHLRLVHPGDDSWPWAFTATEHFRLHALGLHATLTVRNDADGLMPAGLGFHPYLATRPGSQLRFTATGMWLADITQLPTSPIASKHFADWETGAPIEKTHPIDHAFEGWNGIAELRHGAVEVSLAARGSQVLHVYAPSSADFCCLEPVNHLPDALNRPEMAMPCLAPGDVATIGMLITASETPRR